MRRLALITGASAGIGAALAKVYAAQAHDLALTSRRADRLEALAVALRARHGVEVTVLPADLADPAAPDRLIQALGQSGRHVDVLVNNAGYGLRGGFSRSSWADNRAFLEVLTTSVCALTHQVLPGMVQRGYGRVLNVSSLMGLIPGSPGDALYSAAKAFVVSFSEGLHLENRGAGVHVTALCPGLTRSEFHDIAGLTTAIERVPQWMWLEAEAVAIAGYEAVEANRPVCVTGAPNKAAAALARLLPHDWALEVMACQMKRYRSLGA